LDENKKQKHLVVEEVGEVEEVEEVASIPTVGGAGGAGGAGSATPVEPTTVSVNAAIQLDTAGGNSEQKKGNLAKDTIETPVPMDGADAVVVTTVVGVAAPATKKKKKVKKILPHHEHGGGVGFEAFAVCVQDPAASLARWEQYQAQRRREITAMESIATTKSIVATAIDLVDPPHVRAEKQRMKALDRVKDRNTMVDSCVALLCAADPALGPVVKKTAAPVMNATDRDSDQAQLLEQLNISTSRAKVLHFLAVARIRKNELVEQYPMLKQLVAVTDSEGGTTPNPNVLRPLLQASDGDDTSGAVGTIDVRRLMPLLGWDSRVDMVTMERLPGFEIGNEEERKQEEKEEGVGVVAAARTPLEVVRALKKDQGEEAEGGLSV